MKVFPVFISLFYTISARTIASLKESNENEQELPDFNDFVRGKSLMQGEIKELYRTVDKHRDNKIDGEEWADFHTLFVKPFEIECKPDANYLVNHTNLANCLKGPSFAPLRDFTLLDINGLSQLALKIIDSLGSDMNFNDYVHLRKVQIAWEQCADTNGMARIKYSCGVQIVLSGGISLSELDMASVYDTAVLVSKGRLANPIYLDFVGFFITSKEFITYVDFDRPVFTHALSYSEFMRGIDLQLFPIFLSKIDIDYVWELYGDKMDANGFMVFYDTYNLFEKYDEDNDRKLNEQEFMNFLNDKAMDPVVMKNIDNFIVPSLDQVNNQIQQENPGSLNDRTFILNFLQTHNSLRKHSLHKKGMAPGGFIKKDKIVNRKVIFEMLDVRSKKGIQLKELILFRQATWAFAYFDRNYNGYINSEEIKNGLKEFLPPIPFTKEMSVSFNELMVFLTHIYDVNIKEFLSFFVYHAIFDMWKIPNTFDVSLDNLKYLIRKLSLPFSLGNVGEAKESFGTKNRPMYNYRIAFMKLAKDEVKTIRELRLSNTPGVNYETMAFGSK